MESCKDHLSILTSRLAIDTKMENPEIHIVVLVPMSFLLSDLSFIFSLGGVNVANVSLGKKATTAY